MEFHPGGAPLAIGGADLPTSIEPDDATAVGTSTSAARADHQHAIAAGTPGVIEPDDAAAEGVSTSFARADHKHAIAAAAAVEVTDSTNAEGASTSFARADHTHGHGNRSGGDLHTLTSSAGHGFQPRSMRAGAAHPNEGDDTNDGYAVGSYWCDTTNGEAFFCVDATAGAAVWVRCSPERARYAMRIREDWVGGTANGSTNWSATASGAGAAAATVATHQDNTHPGILVLSTGTTTGGRVGVGPWVVGVPAMHVGSAEEVYFDALVRFDNLPDGIEDYVVRVGFGDVKTNAGFTEGVYFTLSRAFAGDTEWRAQTTAASVSTTTDTNTGATAAGWQRLTIRKARGTTTWKFYIDGTLVATHTTNIPTGPVAPVIIIQKAAGTTARLMYNDYVDVHVDTYGPRAA